MEFDTDVLIVGAGPTGLMLACQFLRLGVSFKIIDAEANRTHESRALGVQAKSVEIFQNLGIGAEFLKRARSNIQFHLYVNGKEYLSFFGNLEREDTPFPSLYLLPQSETELTLLEYMERGGAKIEWQKQLISFSETADAINAKIYNKETEQPETIRCKYIVGCDGAHSAVRDILAIPFEGASYTQEFILADAKKVLWDVSSGSAAEFRVFFDKKGIFLFVPLKTDLIRVMGAKMADSPENDSPVSIGDVESLGKEITYHPMKLEEVTWKSRFRLHHRAVAKYQKGRAFLAGDAAHIHSPVGAQGMNTGLQDATNLAWKLALVTKYNGSPELLETYQLERQPIGQILLQRTDRIFGLATSKKWTALLFRQLFLPLAFYFVNKIKFFRRRLFGFVSQLNIHYALNDFIVEYAMGADAKFLRGPKAGYRAPDSSYRNSTLFELFREAPFNILIFQSQERSWVSIEKKIADLEMSMGKKWVKIYKISNSPMNQIILQRYGVASEAIYFIRPDGYIGFRSWGMKIAEFEQYLNKLFHS